MSYLALYTGKHRDMCVRLERERLYTVIGWIKHNHTNVYMSPITKLISSKILVGSISTSVRNKGQLFRVVGLVKCNICISYHWSEKIEFAKSYGNPIVYDNTCIADD